jgi:hypothetical protein
MLAIGQFCFVARAAATARLPLGRPFDNKQKRAFLVAAAATTAGSHYS